MDNVAERKATDALFVTDFLDGVFNINLEDQDIDKMYRLGRWSEGQARPLLVAFKNCDLKDSIMSNLKNLKHPIAKFQGTCITFTSALIQCNVAVDIMLQNKGCARIITVIGVSHDLPPKKREEIKQMVADAKQEHHINYSDDVGNYKFIVVGHGLKKRVIKIKKNLQSTSAAMINPILASST